MTFIPLESERLLYRKFSQDDFPTVFGWLSDAETMAFRKGEPRNVAEVRNYLDWAIANAETEDCSNYEYAVVLKANQTLIGAATLMNIPDAPELGWTVRRDYWRQGYGTEMGKTMLRLGFDQLKLHRIIAGCNARNHGSYKIMERLGMRREAHFVKAQQGNSVLANEWCDRFQYAILREEYVQKIESMV